MKKRERSVLVFNLRWFLVFLIIVIVLYFAWFLFFSYGKCDSWKCFNDNLRECDKTKFIGGNDMIFEYVIKGNSNDKCIVQVELLQGELGNQDFAKLEGHKMECALTRGVVMIPESDIGNCHGMLKEGLQDLVIKKLYTYLVQNLGKLNLEVTDLPKVGKGY